MSKKISESAETSLRGSFSLLIGNTIATIINATGVILVARLLSDSEYGIVTISLVLSGLFNLFNSWGIDQALIINIVRIRTYNEKFSIKNLIRAAYLFRFFIGGILSLIIFSSSDFLATFILKRPDIADYVKLTSFFVLASAIYQTDLSVLAGYEKMNHRSSINVIQSIIKGISSPLLVYLGYSISGALAGHVVSYTVAGLFGVLLVYKQSRATVELPSPMELVHNLKFLILFGLPLFASTILIGLTSQLNGLLLSWYEQDYVIGNYGVAAWFLMLMNVAINSINIALFPTFSKFNVYTEPDITEIVYRGSTKYISMIISPLTILIMTTSEKIIQLLFGSKFILAPTYLSLLILPLLLIGFGSRSIRLLLNSQGKTHATLIINLFSTLTTIILSFTGIQYWGIEGLLVGIIISNLATNLVSIYLIKKIYNIRPDILQAIKIFLASILSGIITVYLSKFFINYHPFVFLVFAAFIYLSTYLVGAPLLGAIKKTDIINLNMIFSKIKIIYPFIKVILSIEMKIIKLRTK